MELRHLQHFIAVAEEKHFTRAAQRANIAQSALSSSIRALEEELGAPLFVRTTRQVRLTAAGDVFLDKARRVLEAAREAREAVAAINGLERGTLDLGAVQSLPAFVDLPALLAEFHGRFPGIEVRLSQGCWHQLAEKLRNGALDLAILPLGDLSPEIATAKIACDALVLVCPARHRLAGRKTVRLAELAREPFVDFQSGWGTRRLVDQGFAEAGLERRTAFEVSDLDSMLALVERGLGVALMPEEVARARREAGRRDAFAVVEIAGPELCWELVVAHRADGRNGASALDRAPRAFLDLLMARTAAALPHTALPQAGPPRAA